MCLILIFEALLQNKRKKEKKENLHVGQSRICSFPFLNLKISENRFCSFNISEVVWVVDGGRIQIKTSSIGK